MQYSKKQAQHYLDLGVPENKLLFLGDINLDPVYNTFRDRIKLRQELNKNMACLIACIDGNGCAK